MFCLCHKAFSMQFASIIQVVLDLQWFTWMMLANWMELDAYSPQKGFKWAFNLGIFGEPQCYANYFCCSWSSALSLILRKQCLRNFSENSTLLTNLQNLYESWMSRNWPQITQPQQNPLDDSYLVASKIAMQWWKPPTVTSHLVNQNRSLSVPIPALSEVFMRSFIRVHDCTIRKKKKSPTLHFYFLV